MKTFKKVLILFMAFLMTASTFVGCGKKDQVSTTKSETQYPAEVSIWTWLGSVEEWGGKSYDEVLCYQELSKRTNTKIKWIHPTGDAAEAFNLMMTSGEMPDMIWYRWSAARCAKYYKAGRIIDLAPLVKQYAPNFMKYVESNPDFKKQVFDPQGRMYFFPWVTLDKVLVNTEGMMLRKDWLDKAGLSIPKTNEELYNALKTMQDKDVNGNGKKDECLTGYPSQIYKLFYGFNVADDWMLQDGKVVYGPATQNYKEALKWFNKLYKEGLLDKDYLTSDGDIYNKKHLNNIAAGTIDNPGVFKNIVMMSKQQGSEISYVPVPYMQYNGVSISLNSTSKRLNQTYGLAVTSSAKNPEQIVKFLDYGFSPEGQLLFNWGVEGKSYTMKDGKPVYSDEIMNDPKYPPTTALTKYANPNWITVTDPRTLTTAVDDLGRQALEVWSNVDNKNAFEPNLWMTDEQATQLKQLTTDLTTFKDEWRDKFITGQANIDEKFDWFVEQLNKMGLEEATKIQQDAYDQYKK